MHIDGSSRCDDPVKVRRDGPLNRGVSGGLVCVWPKLKVRREARLDGRLPV